MARRRKNRTHVKAPVEAIDKGPSSFIIKHGQVGASLSQLVRDLRKLMEPNTASRLKERARNKLRDYLTIAPALHVSHLLAFTLTPIAPYMRMVRLPAGPTLTFRVEKYSLSKDILNTKKHARSMGLEYLTPPLLVLASFPQPSPTTPPHLTLLMKSFQSLFPPLSPQTLTLSSARRVVLVQYDPDHDTVDVRHYLITVKPYGVSRRVRKVLEGKPAKSKSTKSALDLSREQDVADFLLRRRGDPGPPGSEGGADGYESAVSSASSAAGDDDADAVSLADDYVGRNNKRGTRRAVRLDEIGPRMELQLVKITEGIPGKEGAVMYHKFVKKSKAETAAQKKSHAEKERLRKQRREEQERNVARKKAAEGKKGEGDEDASEEEDEEGGEDGNAEEYGEDEDGGEWDDEEEISEGEEHEDDQGESESDEDEPVERPRKRERRKER
ncbi:Brix-domain-containing protein [Fomitiporia mediterranea MF3/22]|uniref:Brix-domain-containing protein n=1 Tax=Fomitiporia mediterranea (strain MF3/22) TaxID=694068 RepID=UPI000440757C|nr:Brix-domain-containing protein [Fomitiporia mediterranea MF3/22]EJD05737.1 Brix-domain-containing protein [Fomitiporia mediterranea MF3/22]